jgi:hypothetical protein
LDGCGLAGLSLAAPAFREEDGLRRCLFVEKAHGVLPVLDPVMLMNSPGMADFSFRPAFR